jgi:biotin operon repressor
MGKAEGGNAETLRIPPVKPKIIKAAYQDKRKFCVIPYEAVRDWKLPGNSLRYLAAFAAYANPAGLTWVSLKRVGEDLGVSHVTVHRHLTKIKARGYMIDLSNSFKGEKAKTRRIIFDPDVSPEDAIAINSSKEDCRDPDMIRKELKDMAKRKKPVTTQATEDQPKSLHNLDTSTAMSSTQPAKLSLDEAIRVLSSYAVNVNESLLRWLEMALELGATRAMLETVAREGDPVGAIKVLVTRLDRACR